MARKKVIDLDCDAIVTFEKVGHTAEGYYIGNKLVDSDFGKSKLHVFQGESGTFGVWGSSKLDEKLNSVPKGAMTFIEFGGKVKIPGGKTMKKFDVEYDDELINEDLAGSTVNFQRSEEPAEDAAEQEVAAEEEATDETPDVDDDTIEAADEDEDAEPRNPVKKPLTKGKPAPTTVTRAQAANVQSLLSKSKR